jgi:hypothetical protein
MIWRISSESIVDRPISRLRCGEGGAPDLWFGAGAFATAGLRRSCNVPTDASHQIALSFQRG